MTSVTFRNKSPEEIIHLASKADLKGIEWGSDIHVPVGDFDQAARVLSLTLNADLKVCAYGSYYVVGEGSNENFRFADVLTTAEILDAPIIRIWAGRKSSREVAPDYRRKVLDETLRIAEEAAQKGIILAFEFHENTLNDSYEACCELLTELDHPYIKTFWQPIHGAGPKINGSGIDMILPWIVGVHVFHWWPNAEIRLALKEGVIHWKEYLDRLSGIPKTVFANIEFVKDDAPEQFFDDAKTLLDLTRYHQIQRGEDERWCLKHEN